MKKIFLSLIPAGAVAGIVARTIRFPAPLNEAIEDAAAAAGYDNVNNYVVEIMARAQAAGLSPGLRPQWNGYGW